VSHEARDFAIETARLRLRAWRDSDRTAMAAMLAHPEVMQDWGGPLSRAASDEKVDRYAAAFREHGFTRWVVERDGAFVGYVGIITHAVSHALGAHADIGWRLVREAWGHGLATEAAAAALCDGFERIGLREVLAYTSAANARSQAVMHRLHLARDAARDFMSSANGITEHELVWVARAGDWKL
jgi:RimJ/RimL family protein N-acetyltransferase